MNHFLYSLISFIIALFFILLGIIGIILPWSPDVRSHIVNFIFEDSVFIFLFGLGFFFIGTAIVVNIIVSSRRRYYEVRSGSSLVKVDETLFQSYLNTYWKQMFPKNEIPNRVTLRKNKIHITADLPYIPLAQQKELLEKIEGDLNDIFNRILGHRHECLISISFQSEPEKAKAKA